MQFRRFHSFLWLPSLKARIMKKLIATVILVVAALVVVGLTIFQSTFDVNGNERPNSVKVRSGASESEMTSSPDATRREVAVGYFDKLDADGPFDVKFSRGEGGKIVLYGKKEFLEHVKVEVRKSCLYIDYESSFLKNKRSLGKDARVEVLVHAQTLREIESEASATFTTDNINSPDALKIAAESGAKVSIGSVTCVTFEADAESGADIIVNKLQATDVKADAESGAGVVLAAIAAPNVSVDAESGAHLTIDTVNADEFAADADSSGQINVKVLTARNVKGSADSGAAIKLQGKTNRVVLSADSGASIQAGKLEAEYATVRQSSGGNITYCAISGDYNNSRSAKNTYKK